MVAAAVLHADDLDLRIGRFDPVEETVAAVDTDYEVVLRPAVQDLGERHVSFVTRQGAVPPAATWLGEILRGIVAERGLSREAAALASD